MTKRIVMGIVAVIVIITALFALWWYGAFLPNWSKESVKGDFATEYCGGSVSFSGNKVEVYESDKVVWETKKDWFVQELLIKDINRDGTEELIMLVWKHGSFGKSRPQWVKRNDIRLEQHIFIYQWDDSRESKIRALWMSSTVGKQVRFMTNGPYDSIIIDENGTTNSWVWQDFGLKKVGSTQKRIAKVICAGDNLVHRTLYNKTDSYNELYEGIREVVENADIAVVNQETPLVNDIALVSDYPRFGTISEVGDALIETGFDVIGLANNHMLDMGLSGIENTLECFGQYDEVVTVGASLAADNDYKESISFVEKNGVKLAFLAYTYGTNGMKEPEEYPFAVEQFGNEERMIRQLEYARARADAVIVLAHWGEEYSREISEEQSRLTELMYNCGVDIVIGSHPHVVQPMELYKDKMLVYYSLGNLISGQNKANQIAAGTGVGALATFEITKAENGTVTISNADLIKINSLYPIGVTKE